MKRKTVLMSLAVGAAGVLIAGFLAYTLVDADRSVATSRSPASYPAHYETLTACEKQEILWMNVTGTAHAQLPDLSEFGLKEAVAMRRQGVRPKAYYHSDFAPIGWVKHLHRRGSVAKVRIVPKDHPYTGLFRGAECALLRLSLTYKVTKRRAVAPGLALKILRDKVPSANIAALVSLDGQQKDFNFFANPMSNIVPMGTDLGQKLVHWIFKDVTRYPEELLANDFAKVDALGVVIPEARAPRQLVFVPGDSLAFSSEEHDVRNDFATIPAGTIVYKVYAVSERHSNFNYANYRLQMLTDFMSDAVYVADIVTTSAFVASSFGDEGMFFRHEVRP